MTSHLPGESYRSWRSYFCAAPNRYRGRVTATTGCRGIHRSQILNLVNVMPNRPKLVLPSEETKHIAALLERELMQWPDVSVRPMFGMHAVYHGAAIFAALPDKRAMRSPRAIAYKLPPAARNKQDKTWQVFEVESAMWPPEQGRRAPDRPGIETKNVPCFLSCRNLVEGE
jgi:hypothetical protein